MTGIIGTRQLGRRKFLSIFIVVMLLAFRQLPESHAANATTGAPFIQIYAMQHQLPESLLPTVQSILRDGESVNAFNHQLVVNASPDSQQQIGQLLRELDIPGRNLLISVRQNSNAQNQTNSTGVSGGIRTGEVILGTGGPVYGDRSLVDDVVVQHDGVRIHSNRTVRQGTTAQEQQLRTMEGYPAWISAGQDIAYQGVDRWGNPVTDFQSADRGFYVTARILGDRVQLEISTTNDQLSEDPHKRHNGVIKTNRLQSSISGAIGEWIPLGGITLQDNNRNSSYNSRDNSVSSSVGDISVKVIPVD